MEFALLPNNELVVRFSEDHTCTENLAIKGALPWHSALNPYSGTRRRNAEFHFLPSFVQRFSGVNLIHAYLSLYNGLHNSQRQSSGHS